MAVYRLTLSTLSPLHIGDGAELRQDFDFVARDGRTYRLNEDEILRTFSERLRTPRGGYVLPGQMLHAEDFQNEALFRYVLRGMPRSIKSDARLRSFLKDAYDRPYIPGSSLKGALRTALAWMGWKEVAPQLSMDALGRNRSWAGQRLERKLFGPDPNRDLLRAVRVSDLFGPSAAGEGLMIINAQVQTLRSSGSPIEVEALGPNQIFTGSVTVDETLFNQQAERILHFGSRRAWLDQLPQRVQRHSRARLERLANWFERAEGTEEIAKFYRRLLQTEVSSQQAFVQLGWGAGWDAKTFSTHLQADSALFERIMNEYKLQRRSQSAPPRRNGDPFPQSRRVAVSVAKGNKPAAPFGWVLLEWEKRS